MPPSSDPVLIVGAGSAGLAAAQALAARGLPFRVLEARDGIGGNWRQDPAPGRSAAYDSLHANVSRWRTSYRAFRLPALGPAFLSHSAMLAYLERYADHFGLREHVELGIEVRCARPLAEGGWNVDGRRARAVVVATGYDSAPRIPALPGTWGGLAVHAHDYRNPAAFAGRRVAVVGMGNSATDLAREIAVGGARSVTLLVRHGRDVAPRRILGVPLDLLDTRLNSRIPWRVRRRMMRPLYRAAGVDPAAAGLPPGPERALDRPFAGYEEIIGAVRRGEVTVRPHPVALREDRLELADGSELAADAIVWATGYEMTFPFLPGGLDLPTAQRVPLYRGVLSLAAPGLFFVGLAGGHGALIPIFEAQANWTGDVLTGRLGLPRREAMEDSVRRDATVRARNFEPRYGVLWDRVAYIRALERECRRPERAARRAAAPTTP